MRELIKLSKVKHKFYKRDLKIHDPIKEEKKYCEYKK